MLAKLPLRNLAPPTSSNQRRLINVSKGLLFIFGAAALSVVTGFTKVATYENEVEFAKRTKEERAKMVPHRCNDRVEDVVQTIFGEEGNMYQDFRPSMRLLLKCMWAAKGEEPKEPYFMLMPGDTHFISAADRAAGKTRADV
eukprot:gene32566-12540_t